MFIGLAIMWAIIIGICMIPSPILGTIVLAIIVLFNLEIVGAILFWLAIFGAVAVALSYMISDSEPNQSGGDYLRANRDDPNDPFAGWY